MDDNITPNKARLVIEIKNGDLTFGAMNNLDDPIEQAVFFAFTMMARDIASLVFAQVLTENLFDTVIQAAVEFGVSENPPENLRTPAVATHNIKDVPADMLEMFGEPVQSIPDEFADFEPGKE